jgi:glutathione S-transferase
MHPRPTLYGFDSSNNIKVRVALGYKGIDYTFHPIDPADRSEIVAISGQFLTPVLTDDPHVQFDSAAILRYLDANFPDTPKLFGGSRDEQWRIEELELLARARLSGPMMEIVRHRLAGHPADDALRQRCGAAFADAATEIAQNLGHSDWLVGDAMSAADISAAAVLYRVGAAGMFPGSAVVDSLAPWVARVMAFDGLHRHG